MELYVSCQAILNFVSNFSSEVVKMQKKKAAEQRRAEKAAARKRKQDALVRWLRERICLVIALIHGRLMNGRQRKKLQKRLLTLGTMFTTATMKWGDFMLNIIFCFVYCLRVYRWITWCWIMMMRYYPLLSGTRNWVIHTEYHESSFFHDFHCLWPLYLCSLIVAVDK